MDTGTHGRDIALFLHRDEVERTEEIQRAKATAQCNAC
jgi:hypothetical protein